MELTAKIDGRFYHLSFWWFAFVSIAVALLTEGMAFLEGWGIYFSDWNYFILCFICFLLCLSYFFFAYFQFRLKPNWLFLALFGALGIGNIVALICFPDVTDTFIQIGEGPKEHIVYFLNDMTRIRYGVSFFISCFYFYLLWAVAPKTMRGYKSTLPYIYAIAALCIALIAYSWVKEWDIYVSFFNPSKKLICGPFLQSFTNNRNTFGSFLLFGVLALGIAQSHRHFCLNYVLMAFFSFEMLFVFSKTSLVLLAVFWVVFIGYRYIVTVRFHPVRTNISLAVLLLCAILAVVTWFLIADSYSNSFPAKINWVLEQTLFSAHHGTIESRIKTWKRLILMLDNPIKIIFGLGEGNLQWFLGEAENPGEMVFSYTHNGYLLQLCAGGVIRFGVYLFLLCYLLYLIIFAFRHKKRGTFAYLVAIGATLGHGLTETTSFLETIGKSVMILIVLVLPLLCFKEQTRNAEAKFGDELLLEGDGRVAPIWSYAFAFLLIASSIAPFFARLYSFDLLYAYIALGAALLLFVSIPLLVAILKKEPLLRVYLPLTLLYAVFAGGLFAVSLLIPIEQSLSSTLILSSAAIVLYLFPLTFAPLSFSYLFPTLLCFSYLEKSISRILSKQEERNEFIERRYHSKRRQKKQGEEEEAQVLSLSYARR